MNLGGHGRADWENMTRLNPLLHEPSELPVMKTSPEQLTKGFASGSLSKTLTNGVAFGALGTGPLSRAAPPPFCSAPAVKALSSRYLRKASCNTNAPFVRRSLSNARCSTLPHRMRSPFSLNESPPMSKSPCPDTRCPLADSSSPVYRDPTWRALCASYQQCAFVAGHPDFDCSSHII